MIALECERNPTKIIGSDKLIPRLQQMLDGWRKIDPPTLKTLPVEADVPEYLATLGAQPSASRLDQAIGDLTLIAFYYLLRIGEYTCKAKRNGSKQTVQFKMEDVTFFKRNKLGELRCVSRTAPDEIILSADGATLKLDNQKNGWKGVCIFHHANSQQYLCPVHALARRYLHLRHHNATPRDTISLYWNTPTDVHSVTAEHITGSKTGGGYATIPHPQRHPDRMSKYTFTEEWRSKCPGSIGLLRYTNSKNGTLARSDVQRVYI
jgi:hypothetical protein